MSQVKVATNCPHCNNIVYFLPTINHGGQVVTCKVTTCGRNFTAGLKDYVPTGNNRK